MALRHYILNDKKEVESVSLEEWATWFEDGSKRRIASNTKTINGMKYTVSTVFIGLEDELFETMVFSDAMDEEYQERCSTYEEAREQHIEACKWVMKQ